MTRVVGGFCLGGVVLSIALGVLEYHRALRVMELTTSRQMATAAHNLGEVTRTLLRHGQLGPINSSIQMFSQDPRVMGVRVVSADGRTFTVGHWSAPDTALHRWELSRGGPGRDDGVSLERPTLIEARFADRNRQHTVQLLVDGPMIRSRVVGQLVQQMAGVWAVLGVLTLGGLLMLRRWLVGPLGRIVRLVHDGAPAEQFERTAARMDDEFGDLAGSLGRMLRRLNETALRLRQRERAFEDLYQSAPTAMVSIDTAGRIIEANRRAAELFAHVAARSLIGRDVLEFIQPTDRGMFRQCIDRLELEGRRRADLRLEIEQQVREVTVEFAAVREDHTNISAVRLSMTDMTQARRLSRQVAEQRRLLNLVINHMSDAILLVGEDGRIITANRRLGQLLHVNNDDLERTTYDAAELWAPLELRDMAAFEQRLRAAEVDDAQTWQETFESYDGAFLFQVVPVCDELGHRLARLWVVQEISAQLRNRRLLEQQSVQLRVVQHISSRLHAIDSLTRLMQHTLEELTRVFQIETIGIALRSDRTDSRCMQLLSTGSDHTLRATGEALAAAVSRNLMPQVLPNRATSYWADLTPHADWAGPFTAAGLESLAATTLYHRNRTQGIVWIARHGGKPIERHHLYLLEALSPMLSLAIENTLLRRNLLQMKLADRLTDLPGRSQLPAMIARLLRRPGHPWSLLLVDMVGFKRINDTLGHNHADAILRRVATQLCETCRASDTVVRYDKDQFVVLCPDLTAAQADETAERLRRDIAALNYRTADGRSESLACTIASASAPGDLNAQPTLIELALARLHQAKASRTAATAP